MNRDRVGVAAAAGLVVAGALVLLRKRGGAKGKTFVLRSDSGIEVQRVSAIKLLVSETCTVPYLLPVSCTGPCVRIWWTHTEAVGA